jgi:chromosome partitioning protein
MTPIFVLTNHKGGVGKSTSATNIAYGMLLVMQKAGVENPRVLLIDTDSQGTYLACNHRAQRLRTTR